MIQFYRRIRQRLLSENKISKYLAYAFGEIVLVVIGILIALSINTWNKGRQDLQAQVELLKDLREDLIIQQELVEEQIQFEQGFVALADSALGFETVFHDVALLEDLLRDLTTRHTFVANKTTHTKMTTSGQISLIHNEELENSIIRYYQLNDYFSAVSSNNNLYIVDQQFGAFVNNNLLGFGIDENGQLVLELDDQRRYQFRVNVQLRKDLAVAAIDRFTQLASATARLLEKIDRELNESN